MPQQIKSQAEMREDRNARDQHGRLWLLSIEKESGFPTGGISPASGWEDVLRTPQKYLALGMDEFRKPLASKLTVLWIQWIPDQRNALSEWLRRLSEIAHQVYPSGFNPREVEHDPFVLAKAGPRPWPSAEVLVAASQGDEQYLGLKPLDAAHRAALGLETLEDRQAPFADADPTTWTAFRQKYLAEGLALKDIGPLWQARKAELQEA